MASLSLFRLRFAFTLGVVALLGCDPGLHYRPESWTATSAFRWSATVLPGVSLETSGIGDLIGSTGLTPEFTVLNRSAEVIVLSGALLETAQGRYSSKPIRDSHEQWFTVQPGETKRITLFFSLPQPVYAVLVPPAILTLTITHGTAVHSIAVPLVRR